MYIPHQHQNMQLKVIKDMKQKSKEEAYLVLPSYVQSLQKTGGINEGKERE